MKKIYFILMSCFISIQSHAWLWNSKLEGEARVTTGSLSTDGATSYDGKVYLYGSDKNANPPPVTVIREFDLVQVPGKTSDVTDLKPTGREIRMEKGGSSISYPITGLTIHPKYGAVFGQSVNGVGTLHRFDFEKALATKSLKGAGVTEVASVEGAKLHPAFAETKETSKGKTQITPRLLVATSDTLKPEIIVLEPNLSSQHPKFEEKKKQRIELGSAETQSMSFDANSGTMLLAQRASEGFGWKIQKVLVNEVFSDTHAPERNEIFETLSGLNAAVPLPNGKTLFVTGTTADGSVITGNRTFADQNTMGYRYSQKGAAAVTEKIKKNPGDCPGKFRRAARNVSSH